MTAPLFRSMTLLLLAASLFLTGCGREKELEQSARPVVTDIIRSQFHGNAQCVAVRISRKLADRHYRAVATLDNGRDIRIMIEDHGSEIKVVIPPDQE